MSWWHGGSMSHGPCFSQSLRPLPFWYISTKSLSLKVIRVCVCYLRPRTLADPFENNADSCKWEVLGRGPDSALTCHFQKVLHPWASCSCFPNKGSTLVISKGAFEQTSNHNLGQDNGNRRKGWLQDVFYKRIRLSGWLHREGKVEWAKDGSML